MINVAPVKLYDNCTFQLISQPSKVCANWPWQAVIHNYGNSLFFVKAQHKRFWIFCNQNNMFQLYQKPYMLMNFSIDNFLIPQSHKKWQIRNMSNDTSAVNTDFFLKCQYFELTTYNTMLLVNILIPYFCATATPKLLNILE